MKENKIESFAELESALSNLNTLADEMKSTLSETQSIYESQQEAWHSANSQREAAKMENYAEEAVTIARNINEVSDTITQFKAATQAIDEQK